MRLRFPDLHFQWIERSFFLMIVLMLSVPNYMQVNQLILYNMELSNKSSDQDCSLFIIKTLDKLINNNEMELEEIFFLSGWINVRVCWFVILFWNFRSSLCNWTTAMFNLTINRLVALRPDTSHRLEWKLKININFVYILSLVYSIAINLLVKL